jgi:hypothetical protein
MLFLVVSPELYSEACFAPEVYSGATLWVMWKNFIAG